MSCTLCSLLRGPVHAGLQSALVQHVDQLGLQLAETLLPLVESSHDLVSAGHNLRSVEMVEREDCINALTCSEGLLVFRQDHQNVNDFPPDAEEVIARCDRLVRDDAAAGGGRANLVQVQLGE